jgi:hypothetical protein
MRRLSAEELSSSGQCLERHCGTFMIRAIRYKAPKVIRNAFEGGRAQREAEEEAARANMQVHHYHQPESSSPPSPRPPIPHQVQEVFEGQQAAGDASDAASSTPQTEILTIVDNSSSAGGERSGAGSMTARSRGSDGGGSEGSGLTGAASVEMLMNSSIFVAKVMEIVVQCSQLMPHICSFTCFFGVQELGFALQDDGFAAKSLIDARMHRLSAAIAAEKARNSKSQNIMSLEREKNLCIKGCCAAATAAAVFLPLISVQP